MSKQDESLVFPVYRPRRLRANETVRRMVRETRLSVDNLIQPLFVIHGKGARKEVPSMPGVFQLSVDRLGPEVREIQELGIPAVILFGIPEKKDETGSEAYREDGVIPQAIRAIKDQAPDLAVITDVCLCEYTSHGHCGIVRNGEIVNDETVEVLAKEALAHARAGADMVAPSDMMDGRVAGIREVLDEEGFSHVPIMSYAAKYASAFYAPFRDAAESTPQFGDRRSYQMDPPNVREALREVSLDIDEGADIVIVKPALAYLDVISAVRAEFDVPVAAYSVSGEYAMIKAAGRNGWLDETRAMMEVLGAIRRAGADLILTYAAKDAARALGRQ
ncbi:MAG: delta-aminolevulinic acid dehydratase [Nitrospirae bacterium RBG_16_64_22]|nr:MAG: delta-aminolevulinic acid dehydratase [Nitrospirae bacterium RBG_16_64_22]